MDHGVKDLQYGLGRIVVADLVKGGENMIYY